MANADPPSIPDPDQHTHTQGSPVIKISWLDEGLIKHNHVVSHQKPIS
jgi:hypothetical protein